MSRRSVARRAHPVTGRECLILDRIGRDRTHKDIAAEPGVSVNAVASLAANVRDEESGRVELVRNFHWERAPGLRGWLVDLLQGMSLRTFEGRAMKSIVAVLKASVAVKASPDS